jgi:hypothetical protein
MKNHLILAVVFAIGSLCIVAWLGSSAVQAEGVGEMTGRPSQLIEARAHAMHADDLDSVRAVADEIFNTPHVLGRMPADVESRVKDRLVRSEIGVLRGTRPGVREEDVVTLFNTMADRFNLPDYIRTSKKQVRALRMSLALGLPTFMGHGLADQQMHVGDSISSEMTVLQAAHLSAVLLDQKFLNPSFQVPPAQWDRESHAREVQDLKDRQELLKSARKGEHHILVRPNPKRGELHDAISKGTASLSNAESRDLMETALKILKVDQ